MMRFFPFDFFREMSWPLHLIRADKRKEEKKKGGRKKKEEGKKREE
jgi:hypothetical protein